MSTRETTAQPQNDFMKMSLLNFYDQNAMKEACFRFLMQNPVEKTLMPFEMQNNFEATTSVLNNSSNFQFPILDALASTSAPAPIVYPQQDSFAEATSEAKANNLSPYPNPTQYVSNNSGCINGNIGKKALLVCKNLNLWNIWQNVV